MNEELYWLVKAFQAVKAGKRPKFNWAAAFATGFWALRKKNFLFSISMSVAWFVLVSFQHLYLNYFSMLYSVVISMGLFGFFESQVVIANYLKNIQSNKTSHKNGRLPFIWVFGKDVTLLLFAILVFTIFFEWINDASNFHFLTSPLFLTKMTAVVCVYEIGWDLALMKFWLPAKQN